MRLIFNSVHAILNTDASVKQRNNTWIVSNFETYIGIVQAQNLFQIYKVPVSYWGI